MAITFRNVGYVYGFGGCSQQVSLQDVNLHIEDGSFLGIAGVTGSGKSTLLRILNGLLKPTSGELVKDGSRIGLVFQYPEAQLFEETVLKDVMFGPLNQGLSEEQARARAKEALGLVGLDSSFEDRSPFELSGGEKRRVAIAGVLAMQPDVLALDEPAAGLDRISHDGMFELLLELNRKGRTIIIVSHDMDDLARYCGQLAYLSDGRLVSCGEPSKVMSQIGIGGVYSRIADRLRMEGFALAEGICTEKDILESL